MAIGRGVDGGVGLGVTRGAGVAPGGFGTLAGGVPLAPGTLVATGFGPGEVRTELPGAIEANVPGASPAAIARSGGGDWRGPRADGAQAAINATTSVAPIAADRRFRCTLRA
jgi:hypothetical protein